MPVIKSIITGRDREELELLYSTMALAAGRAGTALRTFGMDTPEFKKVDAELGKIIRRIRQIRGDWSQGP